MPWFDLPDRATAGVPVAFGHWSTLGLIERPDLLSLDTGCVWGGSLTAARVDGGRREVVQVPCEAAQRPAKERFARGKRSTSVDMAHHAPGAMICKATGLRIAEAMRPVKGKAGQLGQRLFGHILHVFTHADRFSQSQQALSMNSCTALSRRIGGQGHDVPEVVGVNRR